MQFIIMFKDGTAETFQARNEMLDWLVNESDDAPSGIHQIVEAEDIRVDICERAFDQWWGEWVEAKGAEANKAVSSDAPPFLGEMMGAIWLERRISDKCSESGK